MFENHPAIDWTTECKIARGHVVAVTCPTCGHSAGLQVRGVLQRLREGTFTGLCTFCATEARKKARREQQ